MTVHFVIDIETLGSTSQTSAIASIGAAAFEFESSEGYDAIVRNGFFAKTDWMQQVAQKTHVVEPLTMEWWAKQSTEAKELSIKPSAADVPLSQALTQLAAYIKGQGATKESWFWSRGVAFDFPKLEYSYRRLAVDDAINYFRLRDIRTMIDCLTGSTNGQYTPAEIPREFIKHHALHDAAFDAYCMKEIFHSLANGD